MRDHGHCWFIQEYFLKRFDLKRSEHHITKAEIKILIIMCYYVVIGILTLSAYSYYLTTKFNDETLIFKELITLRVKALEYNLIGTMGILQTLTYKS